MNKKNLILLGISDKMKTQVHFVKTGTGAPIGWDTHGPGLILASFRSKKKKKSK